VRSLSLNGTNKYLTTPSSTSLNITGGITVEAWIKLNSIGAYQVCATYSTSVPSTDGGAQRLVPVASGPYTAQLGQAVSFGSSGSFDPDGSIASYHWNFGDGTFANSANPSHSYAAPGLYTATLTVTDNAGLLASVAAAVTISSSGNARLDLLNETGGSGENPLSRNFNWTLPLVSLPGRAAWI
jgi:PKD repeat protein